MNKKGLVFKLIFYIAFLIVLLFLLNKLAKAETAVNIVNITLTINSSIVSVDVSGHLFAFNNSNITALIQQNFTVSISLNASNITIISTNATGNFTCNNATVQVTCNCPSITCPSSISCPSEVDLSNASKELFFNHYQTELKSKIEESSNKVAQDVVFQLAPAKAQFDECKGLAVNATLKQIEAERQRDVAIGAYDTKNVEFINEGLEKKTCYVSSLVFIVIVVISVAAYLGIWSRKGRLFD